MLVKMNCENGSSGYEIGTVTIAVGSQTFQWSKLKQKPTRFFLYKLSAPVAQGDIIHLYDANYTSASQEYQYLTYYYNNRGHFMSATLPSSTDDFIQDITSSGFSIKTSSSTWAGDYMYVATID